MHCDALSGCHARLEVHLGGEGDDSDLVWWARLPRTLELADDLSQSCAPSELAKEWRASSESEFGLADNDTVKFLQKSGIVRNVASYGGQVKSENWMWKGELGHLERLF